MSSPSPITIPLTAAQLEALAPHFAEVNRQAQQERKGILCAQLYSMDDAHPMRGCMRVGFVEAEKAKHIERAAT